MSGMGSLAERHELSRLGQDGHRQKAKQRLRKQLRGRCGRRGSRTSHEQSRKSPRDIPPDSALDRWKFLLSLCEMAEKFIVTRKYLLFVYIGL